MIFIFSSKIFIVQDYELIIILRKTIRKIYSSNFYVLKWFLSSRNYQLTSCFFTLFYFLEILNKNKKNLCYTFFTVNYFLSYLNNLLMTFQAFTTYKEDKHSRYNK